MKDNLYYNLIQDGYTIDEIIEAMKIISRRDIEMRAQQEIDKINRWVEMRLNLKQWQLNLIGRFSFGVSQVQNIMFEFPKGAGKTFIDPYKPFLDEKKEFKISEPTITGNSSYSSYVKDLIASCGFTSDDLRKVAVIKPAACGRTESFPGGKISFHSAGPKQELRGRTPGREVLDQWADEMGLYPIGNTATPHREMWDAHTEVIRSVKDQTGVDFGKRKRRYIPF